MHRNKVFKGNITNKKTPVKRNYKDSLFRMIFSDPQELLALYNAINNSDYHNAQDLEIKTLENAIFLSIKNDLSFLINSTLNLYEHQSSYNPNMPLRDLLYIADQYQEIVKDENIYKETLVKVPSPEFIVFYNGTSEQPDVSFLKLSDMYEVESAPVNLELIVKMININCGHNNELLDKCPTLKEYTLYVDTVRNYAETMTLEDAVKIAVNECINNDVLKKFLLTWKSEAIKMTIYEYDDALYKKVIKEEAREAGLAEGRTVGLAEGRTVGLAEGNTKKLISLICSKVKKNLDLATIADQLEDTPDNIKPLYDISISNPNASVDEIYDMVKK